MRCFTFRKIWPDTVLKRTCVIYVQSGGLKKQSQTFQKQQVAEQVVPRSFGVSAPIHFLDVSVLLRWGMRDTRGLVALVSGQDPCIDEAFKAAALN